MERWVDIVGYEGLYLISDTGLVKSLDRVVDQISRHGEIMTRPYKGRSLKTRVSNNGYAYLHLSKDGVRTTKKIHRLVAEHFIERVEGKEHVNHINGNKVDNVYTNLEWCTPQENIRHSVETGLKPKQQFGEYANAFKGAILVYKDGVLLDRLCGMLDQLEKGYSPCCISSVIKGRQKTHKGCTFIKEIL